MNTDFEKALHHDLHGYLLGIQQVDERLPECPDAEEKWEGIARAYLPDGIREFSAYPVVSLGWMMYVGMAVAQYWERDWNVYAQLPDIYTYLRDKQGYDTMDEYIRGTVLMLEGEEFDRVEKVVGECASRVHNLLRHQMLEPGTPEAFHAYVACLHQLYLMGIAVQLKRMGYHMTLWEE